MEFYGKSPVIRNLEILINWNLKDPQKREPITRLHCHVLTYFMWPPDNPEYDMISQVPLMPN